MAKFTLFLFQGASDEIPTMNDTLRDDFHHDLMLCGNDIQLRLYEIANDFIILRDSGWMAEGGTDSISFYKRLSVDEARGELVALGLDGYVELLKEN